MQYGPHAADDRIRKKLKINLEIKNILPIFASTNKKRKDMKEQHIPVGIYDKEIFIAKVEDGEFAKDYSGNPHFEGVLRPVTSDMLDRLRDMDERRDEYKDLWKQSVAANATEESLDEWLEGLWDEEMDEDDPESFPGKDDSDCQYLTEELRREADEFLLKEMGIEVGTWECAGSYSPHSTSYLSTSDFKDFDYVFDNPTAKALAKQYLDSLRK